jgi:hypothetical protein
MASGYPDPETADRELRLSGPLNPGPWVEHSHNTGLACRYIAARHPELDADKAYALGVLHDIGRRVGIVTTRHGLEGYRYALSQGWDEVARICLTHSYVLHHVESEIGAWDVTPEEQDFMARYIAAAEYDDYDRLLQLCDCLALASGFCLLEKRLVDVARRYGVNAYTVARWDAVFDIKRQFEARLGCSIYDVLPGVKENSFRDVPRWRPPTAAT